MPGDDVLHLAAAAATPGRAVGRLQAVSNGWAARVRRGRAELQRQVAPTGLAGRSWAVAAVRVGPAHDLVAEGSALRVHTVDGGRLVAQRRGVQLPAHR